MTYQVRQAPNEAQIVKQSAQRGIPIPKEIVEAPELLSTLKLYWTCYFDLRKGRSKYDPVCTFRDVQYWCDTYGLDSELARATHDAVLELDAMWIELNPRPKQAPPSGDNRGLSGRGKRN